MRILLDENLDWRLGRGLVGHEVESVQRWDGPEFRMGIAKESRRNGLFEVLITMDSNMTFQLNLADQRLKIVVLQARSNRLMRSNILLVVRDDVAKQTRAQ